MTRELVALERSLERCRVTGSGCWEYVGPLLPNGYAYVHVFRSGARKVSRYLHRLSYGIFKAEIPDGLVIDHLCKNRACCNPEHLDVVTPRVNVLRGDSPSAVQSRNGHCAKGHPHSEANTRISAQGVRECRPCAAIREKRRRTRLRAAGLIDGYGRRIYPEGAAS